MPILQLILSILNAPIIQSALEKAFPDPSERIKQTQALIAQIQASDAAQVEINKQEAQNPSIFISGWRPFIGWVGGLGMAWSFLLQPLTAWILVFTHNAIPLPALDTGPLMALVTALLGLGAMRSYEKVQAAK